MPNLTQPPDNDTDPQPQPDLAPYFRALPPPNWPLIDAVLAEMGVLPAA